MIRGILSRLAAAAAVGASALLPEGMVPGSAEEALAMAILLGVYGVLHRVLEGRGDPTAPGGGG